MISDIIFYCGLGLITMLAVLIGIIVISDAKEHEKKRHKHKHAH